MSEMIESTQDVLDIRYFSEKMLAALYAGDGHAQELALYELAKLAALACHIHPLGVFTGMVSMWNMATAELRGRDVSGDETRQAVFRFFGEMFGKYGLPDTGYEEDEL